MLVSSLSRVALATVALLSTVVSADQSIISTGTLSAGISTPTNLGCYSNSQPLDLRSVNRDYQTQGNCQNVCVGFDYNVFALVNGLDCYCGNQLPAKSFKVDNSKCNTPCPGFPKQYCGGANFWAVWNDGRSLNQLSNIPESEVTSAGGDEKGSTPKSVITSSAVSTSGGKVIYRTSYIPAEETSAAAGDNSDDDDSDTNVTGIVAGVVVGIVLLSAICGGVYFFLRRRRRHEEDEKRRQEEVVAGFVEGGRKPGTSHSSMNDSRLDPELVRRQSDGSIADNQDFSRRILQVTNPDGY